ncbi:MAG: hypothetical protein AAFY36_06735 [Bacteroidota bacterium]
MEITSQNKLIQLWQTLSPDEIRGINTALRSDFFNRREDLKQLFNFLRKQDLSNALPLSRQKVYQATFPNLPFDDLRLRGTMSDLQKRIERYLLIVSHETRDIAYQLEKVRMYRRRKLSKHFEFAHRRLDRLLGKHPWRNTDFFRVEQSSRIEKIAYASSNRRSKDLDLQSVANGIDLLFLMEKLRHACTQLSHQAVHPVQYDFGLLNYIIDVIPSLPFYEVPAVALYYHCYGFLSEESSPEHFQQFKILFTTHAPSFPLTERKDLYLFAINYCIRKHNRGEKRFTLEAWELYRFALEEGLLMENGQISRFTFSNIVGIGIKVDELDWVEGFIDTYHTSVVEKYRTSNLSLNLARLAFARKHFSAALPFLQQVDRSDQLNNLICRSLLIKIFLETDAFDALYGQIDGLDQFLRRREVSDFHRHNYGQFTKFLRQYLALPDTDTAGRQQLKESVLKSEGMSEKEWLLALLS